MRFHSQNLLKVDKSHKQYWLNWRCWIGYRPCLNIEVVGRKTFDSIGFQIELGEQETALGFNLHLGFFSLYSNLEYYKLTKWLNNLTKRKDQTYSNGRSIGIRLCGDYLWIDLWNDPMESRGSDPWWHHISIDLNRLLKGKAKYSEIVEDEGETVVVMPEKTYPATYKKFTSFWKFPRWFTQKAQRISIEVEGGIPEPGKGENSWDCDDDAVYSTTMPFKGSIVESTDYFADSINKTRERRGGKDWYKSLLTLIEPVQE